MPPFDAEAWGRRKPILGLTSMRGTTRKQKELALILSRLGCRWEQRLTLNPRSLLEDSSEEDVIANSLRGCLCLCLASKVAIALFET